MSEIEKVHAKLEHDLHRTPTEEEIAGRLGMSLDEFRDALLEIANSSVSVAWRRSPTLSWLMS